MMNDFRWYFGDREPDDPREAVAQIVLGLCGFGLFCAVWLIVIVLWFKGVV